MKYFKYLTGLALLLIAQQAFAFGFTPSAGDEFWNNLVKPVFGEAGNAGPFGQIISPLINCGLIVAGFMCVYIIIASVAQTANEGEVLGKRFSTVWIVIRVVFAAAFLVPVPGGGGYANVQNMVLWLAKQGDGLGDSVNNAYVDGVKSATLIPPKSADALPLAKSIFNSMVCMEAVNKLDDEGQHEVGPGRIVRYVMDGGNGTKTVVFGTSAKTAECGSYTYNADPKNPVAGVMALHAQGAAAMEKAFQPVAHQIAYGEKPSTGVMMPAVQSYEASVNAALAGLVGNTSNSQNNALAQTMKDKGWLYSGGFYMDAAKMMNTFSTAASSLPTYTSAQDGKLGYIGEDETTSAMKAAQQYIESETQTGKGMATGDSAGSSQDSHMKQITSGVAEKMNKLRLEMEQDLTSSNNPFIKLMALGSDIMRYMVEIMGIVLAISVTASLIPMVSTAGAILQSISPILDKLYTLMFYSATFLFVVLPLIPMITMFHAGIRYLIVILENLLGGILWCLALLIPEGEGVGSGKKGLLMFLNLLLTPALCMASFACAVMLVNPVLNTWAKLFDLAASQVPMTSLNSILFFALFLAAFVIGVVTSITVLFGVVMQVPSAVMAWIDAHTGIGQDHAANTTGKLGAALGGAAVGGVMFSGSNKSDNGGSGHSGGDSSGNDGQKGKGGNSIRPSAVQIGRERRTNAQTESSSASDSSNASQANGDSAYARMQMNTAQHTERLAGKENVYEGNTGGAMVSGREGVGSGKDVPAANVHYSENGTRIEEPCAENNYQEWRGGYPVSRD